MVYACTGFLSKRIPTLFSFLDRKLLKLIAVVSLSNSVILLESIFIIGLLLSIKKVSLKWSVCRMLEFKVNVSIFFFLKNTVAVSIFLSVATIKFKESASKGVNQ